VEGFDRSGAEAQRVLEQLFLCEGAEAWVLWKGLTAEARRRKG
jgi:hypothetical protein